MIFELFYISFGSRKACAMVYDEQRKYGQLFFDLDQKLKCGDQWFLPKDLQPGMKFELSAEEIERAKSSA